MIVSTLLEQVDMRMFQRPEDRMTAAAAVERQKLKAIAEHKRYSTATSRCARRPHPCVPLDNLELPQAKVGDASPKFVSCPTDVLEFHCSQMGSGQREVGFRF